jgi:hypothetical protein
VATKPYFDSKIAAAVFLLLLLGMTRAVLAAGYQPLEVLAGIQKVGAETLQGSRRF